MGLFSEIVYPEWIQQINQNFKTLEELTGTEERRGFLQLASGAETLAGDNTEKAITAANLLYALAARKTISFAGHNLEGACTLAGVKVGDIVVSVTGLAAGTVGDQSVKFESVITVDDQIQQLQASDLSANVYLAVILHKS